jgi:ATP-dependent RNA helicase MSS116, mitochondrial
MDDFQYGAPSSKELYIHRLGRTARAGKKGSGLLVLLPFETSTLAGIGLRNFSEYSVESSPEIDAMVGSVRRLVGSRHAVLSSSVEAAYLSFVVYYIATVGNTKGDEVLESANTFARTMGLTDVPTLPKKLAAELKLH